MNALGDALINFIEMLLVHYLFYRNLELRKGKSGMYVIGILTLFIILMFLNMSGVGSTIRILAMLFIFIAYAWLCFDGNVFEKVLCASAYIVIVLIADKVTFIMAEFLVPYNLDTLLQTGHVRFQMSLIYLMVCSVLIFIITRVKKKNLMLPPIFQIIMLVLMCAGAGALDKLLDISIANNNDRFFGTMNFISFTFLFIILAMMFLMEKLGSLYQQNCEIMEQKNIEDAEISRYQMMSDTILALRGWKHDYKNQMYVIGKMAADKRYEELEDYLKEINGAINSAVLTEISGNSAIDIVVSSKKLVAQNNGIRFDYEIMLPKSMPLNNSELVSVLGNLLDNAIEGCMQIKDEKKKYILLSIKPVQRMLLIRVENSSNGQYRFEGAELRSTKKKKGHGIGLKRVKQLVENVEGFIQCFAEKETFVVVASFPLT